MRIEIENVIYSAHFSHCYKEFNIMTTRVETRYIRLAQLRKDRIGYCFDV